MLCFAEKEKMRKYDQDAVQHGYNYNKFVPAIFSHTGQIHDNDSVLALVSQQIKHIKCNYTR